MFEPNPARKTTRETKVSRLISSGKVPILKQNKKIALEPFYCVIEHNKHISETIENNIFFIVCLKLLDNTKNLYAEALIFEIFPLKGRLELIT